MERSNPKSWVATLTPHRSLTRRGFVLLMVFVLCMNFIVGCAFWAAGAWPVVGFCGLDVLVFWWAFHANFADAGRAERIEITATELILDRQIKGKILPQLRFNRRWVAVELEEDKDRELVGRLFVRFKGRRSEIGAFLAAAERQSLARELRGALA